MRLIQLPSSAKWKHFLYSIRCFRDVNIAVMFWPWVYVIVTTHTQNSLHYESLTNSNVNGFLNDVSAHHVFVAKSFTLKKACRKWAASHRKAFYLPQHICGHKQHLIQKALKCKNWTNTVWVLVGISCRQVWKQTALSGLAMRCSSLWGAESVKE